MHSVESFSIESSEDLKPSAVSVGRPAIRSVLMLSNPHSRASSKAEKNSSAVCLRPIACKTESEVVCGFMLIRSTLFSFKAKRRSLSIVSGRPASTVNSRQVSILKLSFTVLSTLSSCSALSVVGVPPPKYTVSSLRPSTEAISAVAFNSSHKRSTYGSISFFARSIDDITNEQ